MTRKARASTDQSQMSDALFGTWLDDWRSNAPKKPGTDLFIVDNSDQDWKVHDWCQLFQGLDVATGCFEIGALSALDGEWQNVDYLRVLMGDEVSLRTKKAFVRGFD